MFCIVWTKTPVVATRQAVPTLSRNCTCKPPDSVLRCLDQNTCRCHTTGMPTLFRNCTCIPPNSVLHCLDQNTNAAQYGHVNNLTQELHLRNVCRKPGTCRCITTGTTNLSRNCNCGISKQFSHCLGQSVSLHNGHDNILVQKLHCELSAENRAPVGAQRRAR